MPKRLAEGAKNNTLQSLVANSSDTIAELTR
jgi:hypothetical protein